MMHLSALEMQIVEGAWLGCFTPPVIQWSRTSRDINSEWLTTGWHTANRTAIMQSSQHLSLLHFTTAFILLVAFMYTVLYSAAFNALTSAVLRLIVKPTTAALPWLCSPLPWYYRNVFWIFSHPVAMGVDPWVDRRTCPPTFWSGGDALCFVPLTFFGSRHCLLFEELLILTVTPCISVHCSKIHEILVS